MSWPTPVDYVEAMQNIRTALGDPELQTGIAELDSNGIPRPWSGGFASVYKVRCQSRVWAVRCFTKEFQDQQQRYSAISAQLASSKFPFTTHFEFIKQGIRISGNWYPVLKMEWVQGESLIPFVNSILQSPPKLLSLGLDIVEIAKRLNREGVAHGDLQHGNIMVASGSPKLIDYDGMFVPALKGWTTHEAGHVNYQLPRDDRDFGPGLDNFSVWVIYLSLRALSVRPSLWTQFQGGDDCLLFRRKDFENPGQSPLLQALKQLPEFEIQKLTSAFESLLSLDPLQIPLIDPGAPSAHTAKIGADWLRDYVPQGTAKQPAPGMNLGKQWALIDQIPRPSNVYTRPSVPPARSPIPWPATLARTLPPRPATPEILLSAPAWGGPVGLPPVPPTPLPPSILVQPPTWSGPTGLPPVPPRPVLPSILLSPPVWRGPTDLPGHPPEPILPAILTAPPPPPAMLVPPMRHQQQVVPTGWDQRFLGRLSLMFSVVFVPLGLFAGLVVAITSNSSRVILGGVVLEAYPLFGLLLVGLLWLILEWERRQNERQINEQYEAELAQLRAEEKRQKARWEADLAAKQAAARRQYDQAIQSRQTAIATIRTEGQRQHRQWKVDLTARQAAARAQYEQEMQSWQTVVSNIHAQRQRQQKEWEADLARKQGQAQKLHEKEMQSWQAAVSSNQAESQRQQREWGADLAARQAAAKGQHEQEMRSWQTVVSALQGEKVRRQNAVLDLQKKITAAEQTWVPVADRFVNDFDRQKAGVLRLKSDYNDVERQREADLKQLLARAREAQSAAYLRQHLIEEAAIPDIGPGRKRTLKANGVSTAWDVQQDRILRIPKFGPALTANLMEWRRNVETTFIFKTATAISPHQMQVFESNYERHRQFIQQQLLSLEKELQKISQDAEKQLGQLTQQIAAFLTQLYQAQADLTAIPQGV